MPFLFDMDWLSFEQYDEIAHNHNFCKTPLVYLIEEC